MILGNAKAELKIIRLNNGFVLEWETKRPRPSRHHSIGVTRTAWRFLTPTRREAREA